MITAKRCRCCQAATHTIATGYHCGIDIIDAEPVCDDHTKPRPSQGEGSYPRPQWLLLGVLTEAEAETLLKAEHAAQEANDYDDCTWVVCQGPAGLRVEPATVDMDVVAGPFDDFDAAWDARARLQETH